MNQLLAIGGLSPMELIIIVGVIVLLFGSSKIPQLMRGVGSGINEFKKGLKEGDAEAAKAADAPKPGDAPKPVDATKPVEPEKK
jgi:sec-independent protein translocase protein TatA